jgi:hypothetical protein
VFRIERESTSSEASPQQVLDHHRLW